jgi:hypothetical protein
MSISEIKLVYPDDTAYKNWSRRNRFLFKPPRPRCPFVQDYQRALKKWEEVTQYILQQYLDHCPTRILCWKEVNNEGRSILRYRELDYVHGTEGFPKLFIEIKHREGVDTGSSGLRQIAGALAVARNEWPTISGACLNVYMATVLKIDAHEEPPCSCLEDLSCIEDEAKERGDIPVLWIDSKVVATYAVRSNLMTEVEVCRLPKLRELAQTPLQSIGEGADYNINCNLGHIWPD